MRKLNFGCGGLNLEGWENYDIDVDISKPLPFPDGCASFIFAEHVVEHISHQEAWSFFEECLRVLGPRGVLRLAIPDIGQIISDTTGIYAKAVKMGGHGDNPVRAAICEHGHKAAWNKDLLCSVLLAVGFVVWRNVKVGYSEHRELNGIEQHWRSVGREVNEIETSVVEATKP